MQKMITVVLVGAGNRANVYASVSLEYPEKMKVVGIVDPDPIRRELMRERYNVSLENCFADVSEFVQREKFADAVINGTMDHLHVPTSIPILEKVVQQGKKLLIIAKDKINQKGHSPAEITDESQCIGCAFCATMCPDCAITVER